MSAPNWINTVTTQSVTSADTTTRYTRQMTVNTSAGRSNNQKRTGRVYRG